MKFREETIENCNAFISKLQMKATIELPRTKSKHQKLTSRPMSNDKRTFIDVFRAKRKNLSMFLKTKHAQGYHWVGMKRIEPEDKTAMSEILEAMHSILWFDTWHKKINFTIVFS